MNPLQHENIDYLEKIIKNHWFCLLSDDFPPLISPPLHRAITVLQIPAHAANSGYVDNKITIIFFSILSV